MSKITTSTMRLMYFAVIFVLSFHEGQASTASELLKIRTSIAVPGGKVEEGMSLSVRFRQCGYIFCDAPDVLVDDTKHYWDYYVDWEMPDMAKSSPNVFVMANRFQMPRSYLVFKNFVANFTGEYRCIVHFRDNPITSFALNLTLSDDVFTEECSNATH